MFSCLLFLTHQLQGFVLMFGVVFWSTFFFWYLQWHFIVNRRVHNNPHYLHLFIVFTALDCLCLSARPSYCLNACVGTPRVEFESLRITRLQVQILKCGSSLKFGSSIHHLAPSCKPSLNPVSNHNISSHTFGRQRTLGRPSCGQSLFCVSIMQFWTSLGKEITSGYIYK